MLEHAGERRDGRGSERSSLNLASPGAAATLDLAR
jgi:hypothetical protein